MTTTRPGSFEAVDGETREPTGRGSFGFDAEGKVNVKVSGDCEVDAYGHTIAWVWVRLRAYPEDEKISAC